MAEPREERAEPLQTAARKINWRLLPPLSLLSIIW